jgi:hypothetical protein
MEKINLFKLDLPKTAFINRHLDTIWLCSFNLSIELRVSFSFIENSFLKKKEKKRV